jgi:hypothetical protein
MRITEGQLRSIVRRIIREGSGVEVDKYFSQFEKEDPDYTDPKSISDAFAEAMRGRHGGTRPNQREIIDTFADSLKGSLGSMTKNYAMQVDRGAPDSQKLSKQEIANKVMSYISKAEREIQKVGEE